MSSTPKKRNAQDATRKHDVTPLRRRISVLEADVKALKKAMLRLQKGATTR
jgi:tRNA1(Val) A37 N6-methylase TrmN6